MGVPLHKIAIIAIFFAINAISPVALLEEGIRMANLTRRDGSAFERQCFEIQGLNETYFDIKVKLNET